MIWKAPTAHPAAPAAQQPRQTLISPMERHYCSFSFVCSRDIPNKPSIPLQINDLQLSAKSSRYTSSEDMAINPYHLCRDWDFNVPINKLLCKLHTCTISRVIMFPWQPQDYFVKSLALWKIARQYQYRAVLMPLEPLQVLLQTQERTWKGTVENVDFFFLNKTVNKRMKCNSKVWEREVGNLKRQRKRYFISKFLPTMFCLCFSFWFCSQNVVQSCSVDATRKMHLLPQFNDKWNISGFNQLLFTEVFLSAPQCCHDK